MLDPKVRGTALMGSAARFMMVLVDLLVDATNVARMGTIRGIVASRPSSEYHDLLSLRSCWSYEGQLSIACHQASAVGID